MYNILYEDSKYAKYFVAAVEEAVKCELAEKKLCGKDECCFVKGASDQPLMAVGSAEWFIEIIGENRFVAFPIDIVIVMEKGTWDKSLEFVVKSPKANVLHIIKLNGSSVKSEDICAFCETAKELVRAKMRNERGMSEESDSQSKPVNWKCSVNNTSSAAFFSFFSDPSMRTMCRELKDAVLGLEDGCQQMNGVEGPKDAKNDKLFDDYLNSSKGRRMKPPSILLLGETGTGKTLAAQWVAEALGFKDKLASLNIGAVKGDTTYSSLFGACRGSYTDAHRDMPGIFIKNAGRAIFLDEIGDISPDCQVCMLKYLDNSEVRPLGWPGDAMYAPALVIAATNKPLDKMVSSGDDTFRNDLFYRFDYVVHIPPLRERKKDMRFLISVLLQDKSINPETKNGERAAERISIDAIEYLECREYPGNFRDLRNTIIRAVRHAQRDGSRIICLRHVVN